MAFEWLQNSRTLSKVTRRAFNRPISKAQVMDLVKLLEKEGQFEPTEDTICVSDTNKWGPVIYNGQHRIAAIVLVNEPVTIPVYSDIIFPLTWKADLEPEEIIEEPEWCTSLRCDP